MARPINDRIRQALARLNGGFRRFPEAMLMNGALVACLIESNHLFHSRSPVAREYLRLSYVFAVGMLLFLCFRRLTERFPTFSRGQRLSVQVGIGVLLFLFYEFGLSAGTAVAVCRVAAICLSLALVFLLCPFLGGRGGFSVQTLRTAFRFLVAYLFATILFVGLVALVASWRLLFGVNVDPCLYLDFWSLAWGLFGPVCFLTSLPTAAESLEPFPYPPLVRSMQLYLVMPFLTAYALTLIVYCAKILITLRWPVGMVAPMVLLYGAFSVAVAAVVEPLRSESAWCRRWWTFTFWSLVPLLIMMFSATWMRIQAFGVTESRYCLVVGGAWLLIFALHAAGTRRPRLVRSLLLAPVLALAAVYGPWSCFEVSIRSQNQRLEALLDSQGRLRNGRVVPVANRAGWPAPSEMEISSILNYFDKMHGLDRVRCLPSGTDIQTARELTGIYPRLASEGERGEYVQVQLEPAGEAVDITGYTAYFPDPEPDKAGNPAPSDERWRVHYDRSDQTIRLFHRGRVVYRCGLADPARQVLARLGSRRQGDLDQMTWRENAEDVDVLILFHSFSGFVESGRFVLSAAVFDVFVRERD